MYKKAQRCQESGESRSPDSKQVSICTHNTVKNDHQGCLINKAGATH